MKKKVNNWNTLFGVTSFMFFMEMGSPLSSLVHFSPYVLAGILGAAGFAVGLLLYRVVADKPKKVKIAAYAGEIVLCAAIFFAVFSYSSEKKWKFFTAGSMQFEYCNELQRQGDAESAMSAFGVDAQCYSAAESGDAAVLMYLVYDFKESFSVPVPADSLEGAVDGALQGFSAENMEILNLTDLHRDNLPEGAELKTADVRYRIGSNEFSTFATIYANGRHYELLIYLPVKIQKLDRYINRIRDSVRIGDVV